MDQFLTLEVLDKASAFAVLVTVAVCVITGKLVWHTQLKKVEDRADRWERVALEALSAGAAAGVKAAEVTVDVVSAMPDPQLDNQRGG
jgi:hypothetical protein